MCHYYADLCKFNWHSLYTELLDICTTFNVTKVTKLQTTILEVYTQLLSFIAKFVCVTFGEASSFCGNDKGCLDAAAAATLIAVLPQSTQN
jgi:hypothetical protein